VENYRLLIFPSAKRDLQGIVDYINDWSEQAALNIYDGLIETVNSLAQMPYRCPFVKDRALRARGYRIMVAGSYLVFYVVKGQTVEIRRILHGRRRYEFLV